MENISLNPIKRKMTPLKVWQESYKELDEIKNSSNRVAVKRLEEASDLFGNSFQTTEDEALYRIEVSKKVLNYLKSNKNIVEFGRLLAIIESLGIKHLSFDLVTTSKANIGERAMIEMIHKVPNKRILKVYTDGSFFLKPTTVIKDQELSPISNLTNNTWTIATDQSISNDKVEVANRVMILHTLTPSIASFPTKKELDSMEYPKISESFQGQAERFPWGYQQPYNEVYNKVGISYQFKKVR